VPAAEKPTKATALMQVKAGTPPAKYAVMRNSERKLSTTRPQQKGCEKQQ